MRLEILVIGVVFALNTGPVAQSDEEAAVNDRVDRLFEVIREGDAEAHAAFYHENGILALNTDVLFGRANIAAAGHEEFAEGGPPITFTHQQTTVLPEVAVIRGVSELRGNRMHTMITLTRESNEWFVAALQYAPVEADK